MRKLLKKKAEIAFRSVKYDNRTPLEIASQNGHLAAVQRLIDAGADVNAKDLNPDERTPLFSAAYNGYSEIVQALINAGADVNYICENGFSALDLASRHGHFGIVQALINAGADVNECGSILVEGASGGYKVVRALIDAGADVNAVGDNDNTALINAAAQGDVKSVKALVDAGADINHTGGICGNMALQTAAEQGHQEVFEFLLDAGDDSQDGTTVLLDALTVTKGITALAAVLNERGWFPQHLIDRSETASGKAERASNYQFSYEKGEHLFSSYDSIRSNIRIKTTLRFKNLCEDDGSWECTYEGPAKVGMRRDSYTGQLIYVHEFMPSLVVQEMFRLLKVSNKMDIKASSGGSPTYYDNVDVFPELVQTGRARGKFFVTIWNMDGYRH